VDANGHSYCHRNETFAQSRDTEAPTATYSGKRIQHRPQKSWSVEPGTIIHTKHGADTESSAFGPGFYGECRRGLVRRSKEVQIKEMQDPAPRRDGWSCKRWWFWTFGGCIFALETELVQTGEAYATSAVLLLLEPGIPPAYLRATDPQCPVPSATPIPRAEPLQALRNTPDTVAAVIVLSRGIPHVGSSLPRRRRS
jgi:hypothetical protein